MRRAKLILLILIAVCAGMRSSAVLAQAPTIRVINDVAYYNSSKARKPDRHQRLDWYLPSAKEAIAVGHPVLVFTHGGSWSRGDKRSRWQHLPLLGRSLARAGIVVAMVNHRLSPKVKHPAHVTDLARAVRFVRREVGALGGDPERIFVGGHSSGGHLAALLVTNPRWLESVGLTPAAVRGVVSMSGVYDLTLFRFVLHSVFPLGRKISREASPVRNVAPGVPPFFMVVGTRDIWSLERQGRRMHEKLLAARARSTLEVLKGVSHMGTLRRFAREESELFRKVVAFIRNG